MRYVRVYLGASTDDPGITLYEIDLAGWVHRQVEIMTDGTRFAPEHILMLSAVDVDGMASHPAAEEIDRAAFEGLWQEVEDSRPFREALPDPSCSWEGYVQANGQQSRLRWHPDGHCESGWARVPGFTQLFVEGDHRDARMLCRAVFLDPPVEWGHLGRKAA